MTPEECDIIEFQQSETPRLLLPETGVKPIQQQKDECRKVVLLPSRPLTQGESH